MDTGTQVPFKTLARLGILAISVSVVAILYFAKTVFVPLALALLISFLLAPIVGYLQGWAIRRLPAVLITVFLCMAFVGLLGWIVTQQMLHLADNLPHYKENIQAKVKSIQYPWGKRLEETSAVVEELAHPAIARPEIPKVEVVEQRPSALKLLSTALGPLVTPLGTAGVVIILVIFLLIKREDLRNRFICLIGTKQLYLTTKAVDDAAGRISRFLFTQMTLNLAYGMAIGAGLYCIGLPNAVLWGVLSAILRFIPYLGTWIAAMAPIALAMAVSHGWTNPMFVIGLFLILELIINNWLEPWLYGQSTGVSPFALIVAAIFWTWLWGSAGLFLSAPLTVCLVVMGKHVPELKFLNVLLGDQPTLEPKRLLYQRLLAMDEEEATEIVESSLMDKTPLEVADIVLIPALGLVEQDRHRNALDRHRAQFVFETLREIVDGLITDSGQPNPDDSLRQFISTPSIVALPAHDQADEIAVLLFVQILKQVGIPSQSVSLSNHNLMLEETRRRQPNVICVCALPPLALAPVSQWCKRIRSTIPGAQILVGLWNADGDVEKARERIETSGANYLATTLAQSIEQIRHWSSAVSSQTAGVLQTANRLDPS